jgi:tetratricopeptide (TPR) repeat protein
VRDARILSRWAICGAFAVALAGAEADAQMSRPATAPARSAELLLQAVSHYQRSEFDEARKLLAQVLRVAGGEQSRLAQEAYTYLAFVHVAFNETEAAVAAFERALAINPELALASPSPRIAAALEQARRRYRARVQALDHDPPRQVHEPVARSRWGQAVTIRDQVSDPSGVRRVVLNYRIAGNRGFSSVTMERDGKGRYLATIPGPSVVRPGVDYYLEAWDSLGNGPGLKGSPGAPIRLTVEGGPLAASEQRASSAPWYKRWWVWAAVAGAVAVAGGAATAAYLSRTESARFDMRLSKDLNP